MSKVHKIKVPRGKARYQDKNEKSELSLAEDDLRAWPTLDSEALRGFAGRVVELATEHSEADPAAVLMTFLTRFAVECGTHPYFMIGDTKHYPRIFSVIVGATSKARKGTSGKPVKRLFSLSSAILDHPDLCKIEYTPARESPGPLSSGEGIVFAVRDKSEVWSTKKSDHIIEDPGVNDKRLFVLDEEFGSALSCTKREGNTLSTILRCAWDTGTIEPLTKTSRTKATGAHIGICTHITRSELDKKLNETEAFNGFANRFLWCCAKRSKLVALPKPMNSDNLWNLQKDLVDIIAKAISIDRVRFDKYAEEYWESIYENLSKDRGGLFGSVTDRAEAQVIRLSMIYALLNGKCFIAPEHLKAAVSLWKYCEASAGLIFSGKESNPFAGKILEALQIEPKSTTELYGLFAGNVKKDEIHKVLQELIGEGKITKEEIPTGGRPKILFRKSDNSCPQKGS